MVPVECVVRGYITGSGWKDYQATGAVCGIELPDGPPGVRAAARADLHARHQGRGGRPRRERGLRPRRRDRGRPRRCSRSCAGSRSRSTRTRAEHARERGIILADTKFEFGRACRRHDRAGRRGAARPTRRASGPPTATSPAARQPSFDKQFVRDWAAGSGWDKAPPAPPMPGRGRRRHARALRGGLRADRRRAVRALARAGAAVEGPRPDPPQGGDPRPAGPGGGARPAGAGLRGREQRARRPHGRAGGRGHRRACTRCASGCWPTRSSRTTRYWWSQ